MSAVNIRMEIARLACHEVQDLADMLREHVALRGESDVSHVIRGTLMRISTLSDVIHDAVITDRPEHEASDLVRIVGCNAVVSS